MQLEVIAAGIQCRWCWGWRRTIPETMVLTCLGSAWGSDNFNIGCSIWKCLGFLVGGFSASWFSFLDVLLLKMSLVVDKLAVFGSVFVFEVSCEAFLLSFLAFSLYFFSSTTGVNVNHIHFFTCGVGHQLNFLTFFVEAGMLNHTGCKPY